MDIQVFPGVLVVLCLRHNASEVGPRAGHHVVASWPVGSTPYGYYAPANAKKSGSTIC